MEEMFALWNNIMKKDKLNVHLYVFQGFSTWKLFTLNKHCDSVCVFIKKTKQQKKNKKCINSIFDDTLQKSEPLNLLHDTRKILFKFLI